MIPARNMTPQTMLRGVCGGIGSKHARAAAIVLREVCQPLAAETLTRIVPVPRDQMTCVPAC